jgi:hypothetical protein
VARKSRPLFLLWIVDFRFLMINDLPVNGTRQVFVYPRILSLPADDEGSH